MRKIFFTILVNAIYYTADNVDGYLLSIYPRILIRKCTGKVHYTGRGTTDTEREATSWTF